MGKIDFESMTEDELKLNTRKGSAYYRISQAVETIKNHNDSQGEKKLKFFISPTLIFKLTGSNRKSITLYFEQHQTLIDEHNSKHELTELDNRKGKDYDVKKVLVNK
jgi:hypothetical protein